MSAVDFLFTPSVRKVLRATLLNPQRRYSLGALLDIAESGRGSTQKQIERLISAGVLIEERPGGRLRMISANPDYFLFDELCSIARKTFGVIEPVSDALQPFWKDIEQAFLHGSVVKGTDSGTSDIDLVLIGNPSYLGVSQALTTLEQTLKRAVHFEIYHPDEWATLCENDPVVQQIANGPKWNLELNEQTS
ncbi:MAG TPA: nucleotidyltransferase domain-containing protein [Limnobacter sp.]|uniref:nucleotidyltransferase domain-containing protein n=1 Tax=Limnobacter sp. TaxID=2003368 RepID=UPI002ED8B4A6